MDADSRSKSPSLREFYRTEADTVRVPSARVSIAAGKNLRIATLTASLLTALFAWTEWKQGAYFGTVFYPVGICLFVIVVMLTLFVAMPTKIAGPLRICLWALLGIGAMTLLSPLWSSTPAAGFAYSERVFFYAALLLVGAWTASLAGRRWEVALAPVAIAGTGVALASAVVLATGSDIGWYLQGDGTLRFPIGYRNAEVAFLLICVWPLLGIALSEALHWALRAAAVAGATLLLALAVIGQSRGSLPALGIALVVFVALSAHRLRATIVAALAAAPFLPFISPLLGVFRYGSDESDGIPILHEAARAALYSAALSFLVAGVVFALIQPRVRIGEARVRALSWAGAVVACVALLVGAGAFLATHGGPIGFIEQKTHEFDKIGYPNLHSQGVRFGANIGSNRHDFWRVAVDEGLKHPVLGGGAGSFQLEYLQHRRSYESPHDPHSLEAVIFGELGFPGLLMLVAFVVGGVWAVVRARRRRPGMAYLVAGGAAAATQWLVHGSYDWFWQYAGITGLGMYMLGVAAAPSLDRAEIEARGPLRYGVTVVLVAICLIAVPFFVSETYEKKAHAIAETDPSGAVDYFRKAADLDPWAVEPLIGQGLAEEALGQEARAAQTFRRATNREPEDYAPYLLLAEVLADSNRAAAARAIARAAKLNPLEPRVRALRADLK